jgi:hypothetical protein
MRKKMMFFRHHVAITYATQEPGSDQLPSGTEFSKNLLSIFPGNLFGSMHLFHPLVKYCKHTCIRVIIALRGKYLCTFAQPFATLGLGQVIAQHKREGWVGLFFPTLMHLFSKLIINRVKTNQTCPNWTRKLKISLN